MSKSVSIFTNALTILLLGIAPLFAKIYVYNFYGIVQQSDIVVVGTVSRLSKDTATLDVSEVLTGNISGKAISISPILRHGCPGDSINFKIGEEALVYGKRITNSSIEVAGGGQGKISLTDKTKQYEIAAARRIIEINSLKSDDDKIRAMFAEVRSKNKRLFLESHAYLVRTLTEKKKAEQYTNELIPLLKDPNADVQRVGLQSLEYIKSQAALPRIIELSRSNNLMIVDDASLALGAYDNPEAVSAIVALTKHKSPDIRKRACLDLGNHRRENGRSALIALLDDKDESVRAMAPRCLVQFLRNGETAQILPKLITMTKDSSPAVQEATVYAIGESHADEGAMPLIEILSHKDLSPSMERVIYQALANYYSRGDALTKAELDKHIDLYIAALKRNDSQLTNTYIVDILYSSMAPSAKVALKWAADNHPDSEAKSLAARLLALKK